MTGSERLSQEDAILRQIRLTISTFRTMDPEGPGSDPTRHRRGVMYGSYPITSGRRLFAAMRQFGFTKADEFRFQKPEQFRRLVLQPNIKDGHRFGDWLRDRGWPLTIVPSSLYARDWNQEHYMSLWRQVIIIFSRSVGLDEEEFPFSMGSAEEFLIGLQHRKRLVLRRQVLRGAPELVPADPNACLLAIRRAIDQIDAWGFDPMPMYNIWRQAELTLEAQRPTLKTA
jgi:hypothetical protein